MFVFVTFQMCFLVKRSQSAAEFTVKDCARIDVKADATSGKAEGGQKGLDMSVSGSVGGRLTVNMLFGNKQKLDRQARPQNGVLADAGSGKTFKGSRTSLQTKAA